MRTLRALAIIIAGLTLACGMAHAGLVYTFVSIPTTNNIQTGLESTFPTGTFVASNVLATPFSIPSAAGKCGPGGASPCNYYDGFGFSGNGTSITLNVSVPGATDVFALLNAYAPPAGQQLATMQFTGTGGASASFALIGGNDIRDFFQGVFANTLTNTVSGVNALNAFSCNDPGNCLGAGGTGNVNTGGTGNYVVDEQDFSLGPSFVGQTLTQIVFTDTDNGPSPILLGVTVGAPGSTGVPEPATIWMLTPLALAAVAWRLGRSRNQAG